MQVTTQNAAAVQTGFTISEYYAGKGAFILDNDGEYVWWYEPSVGDNTWVRARMSQDGKYMWIANGNVAGAPSSGVLVKVKMDGTEKQTFSAAGRHHDLLVLPDDTVVYVEYDGNAQDRCDRVVEMNPDGTDARAVFLVRDHFAHLNTGGEWCHSNAINYVPSEDAYYMSVLNKNMIIKWKRSSGELIWVFGGTDSDYQGVSWDKQHQHHILPSGILIFNNNGGATGGSLGWSSDDNPASGGFFGGGTSHVLEYTLNESSYSASLVIDYSRDGLNTMSMGDAKRMPNGNTLVTYSNSGVINEIDGSENLVREMKWSGGQLGYANRVEDLYAGQPEYGFYPHK